MMTLDNNEQLLLKLRFPEGVFCLKCGGMELYTLKMGQWKCQECSYRFRLFTGTFLEQVKLSPLEIVQLVFQFVHNEVPEDRQLADNTDKTVYKFLNIIRQSICQELSQEEQEWVYANTHKMFVLCEDSKQAHIIPLDGFKGVAQVIKLHKKGKLGYLAQYQGIITKKIVYPFYSLPHTQQKIVTREDVPFNFIDWYVNNYMDKISTVRSKNFSLLLKSLEFLYNTQKRPGVSPASEILKLLLKPKKMAFRHKNIKQPII